MEKNIYSKFDRFTYKILKLQSLNKQVVALLAQPRQAEFLVIRVKNIGKNEKNFYKAVFSIILNIKKLAKLGL